MKLTMIDNYDDSCDNKMNQDHLEPLIERIEGDDGDNGNDSNDRKMTATTNSGHKNNVTASRSLQHYLSIRIGPAQTGQAKTRQPVEIRAAYTQHSQSRRPKSSQHSFGPAQNFPMLRNAKIPPSLSHFLCPSLHKRRTDPMSGPGSWCGMA